MRIVAFSTGAPSEHGDGTSIRIWHSLRALRTLGDVHHVLIRKDCSPSDSVVDTWIRVCSDRLRLVRYAKALARRVPTWLIDLVSPSILAAVRASAAESAVTVALDDYAGYVLALSGLSNYAVDQHNLRGRLSTPPLWRLELKALSLLVLSHAQCSVVTSELERDVAIAWGALAGKIKVVRSGCDIRTVPLVAEGHSNGHRMGFVGNWSYRANLEGAQWFATSVLPLIRLRFEDAEIIFAGRSSESLPKGLGALTGVRIAGEVPSVEGFYATTTIGVAPIFSGAGTRLKVTELFGLGHPAVVTSAALEGTLAKADVHCCVADTPEEFASACVYLLRSRDAARCLAQRAWSHARSCLGWRTVEGQFADCIAQLSCSSSKRLVMQ